jgi:hypothetical protein
MHSYQSFTPGRNSNSKKLINYCSHYQSQSNCFQENYKQFKTAENDPNISNALRISNLLKNNIKGKIRIGNTYLNTSLPFIDQLGSIEGQPGGSFTPLRNKF